MPKSNWAILYLWKPRKLICSVNLSNPWRLLSL
ncbi:UNVERIFIED_CONTAM: hypothetical protein GTU68_032244 [Idotea baltica]|nr:hypothetical protein [Idotea baltica]